MLSCCLCNAKDRPEFTHELCNCKGGEILGHDSACSSIGHFVRKQHLYKDEAFLMTKAYTDKGWKLKGRFQKFANALERFICRECIEAQREMSILAKECRDKALEVEGRGAKQTWYQDFCN